MTILDTLHQIITSVPTWLQILILLVVIIAVRLHKILPAAGQTFCMILAAWNRHTAEKQRQDLIGRVADPKTSRRAHQRLLEAARLANTPPPDND